MINFQARQAKRELIWAKIAMLGASGSGKTYSALRMATGMLKQMKEKNIPQGNGKILLINTEGSRGLYYADEFTYDILNTDDVFPNKSHNPEHYVEAISWAESEHYPICILDSSSAEWEGKGGCLELQQLAGGTFQSWAKVTPRHNNFIQALATSKIHIIATMRGKDQYEIEKDGNKTTVKKLGVGAKQRDNFEYEFTSTFSLDESFAVSQKDNTHIFESKGRFKITETDGANIIDWANSEKGYTPKVKITAEQVISHSSVEEGVYSFDIESDDDPFPISEETLESLNEKNMSLCMQLNKTTHKEAMLEIMDKVIPNLQRNPKKVVNFEIANKLNQMLTDLSQS